MIEYLADRIADYFVKEELILAEDRSIYKYGSEVSISTILGISLILLIGLISGQVFGSILFLLCFIPLRVYTGGYHADTYLKCNLSFCAVFIIYLVIKNNIPPHMEFFANIIFIAVSLITIFVLAPIENKHKPFHGKEKLRYRKISIIVSVILSVLSIVAYAIDIKIYIAISLTMVSIAILMVVEKIKVKWEKKGD